MNFRRYYTGAICLVILLAIFCAKKKNPAQWDNPQDQTGANWHPPTVVMMEGGAVPYRDTLYVTASATDSNGTILDFCWGINGNGYYDTTITGTLDVYLPDTGWYTIRVKARDNDKLLSLPDSVLLYATFHPPVVQGMPDFAVSIYDTFTLTATGTDSNGVITKYLWALDGVNYTEESMAGSLRTVFSSEGIKSVKVRAVDDDGLPSLPDEVSVTVRLDAPEVTAMNDISVSIYDTISITATSSDPNGSVISYHWAFDGLHFMDSTDTGFVQHVFDSAGVYEVKVKVKDDDGIFSVDDAVRITVNTDAPIVTVMNDFSTSIYDTVVLTASGSDANGEVVRFLWALDGSSYLDTTVSGSLTTAFLSDGLKTVRVKVVDDDGFESPAGVIEVAVALNAPTIIVMGDTVLPVGVDATLHAQGSDANGRIVQYYWALDGATFADSTDSGIITHQFAFVGTYRIKVRVKDDDGLISPETVIMCIVKEPVSQPLYPSNGAMTSKSILLRWAPGAYFNRFNVKADTVNPPVQTIATALTDTIYPLVDLNSNDTYYWQIICFNSDGNSVTTPIMSFTVRHDTIVDLRDGQVYSIVTIGDQTWMAENLRYGTMLHHTDSVSNNYIVEMYAYDDDTANISIYGGLYTGVEAQTYNWGIQDQGACPSGWHIPEVGEWTQLANYLGWNDAGDKLRSGGSSGFDAVYSGYYSTSAGFSDMGYSGYYLGFNGSFNAMIISSGSMVESDTIGMDDAVCVRCVKD